MGLTPPRKKCLLRFNRDVSVIETLGSLLPSIFLSVLLVCMVSLWGNSILG